MIDLNYRLLVYLLGSIQLIFLSINKGFKLKLLTTKLNVNNKADSKAKA